ncbi:hypothetical protein D3C73_1201060 [compost metagenome]
MSGHNRTDGVDQRFRLHVFQQVTRGPLAKRLEDIAFVIVNRENDNFDQREDFLELLRCRHAVLHGHVDVHKHDVRFQLIAQLNNLNPVSAFAHDLEIILHVDDPFDSFPKKLVIVGQYQLHGLARDHCHRHLLLLSILRT